jgi:hypothetical protein
MSFDRPVTYQDDGASIEFTSVVAPARLSTGPATTVCIVRPQVAESIRPVPAVFVLKEIAVAQFIDGEIQVKNGIVTLEKELVIFPISPFMTYCSNVLCSSLHEVLRRRPACHLGGWVKDKTDTMLGEVILDMCARMAHVLNT